MAEFPIFEAAKLEIRRSGGMSTLSGRFNYGSTATVRDRGRVRKERFEPRAFRFAIEDETRQLDILVGHDFGKPIASRKAGTLSNRGRRRRCELRGKASRRSAVMGG